MGTGQCILMPTHNLCFGAKIKKIGIPQQTPIFFSITKWGFKGYTFHGHVFEMLMQRDMYGRNRDQTNRTIRFSFFSASKLLRTGHATDLAIMCDNFVCCYN